MVETPEKRPELPQDLEGLQALALEQFERAQEQAERERQLQLQIDYLQEQIRLLQQQRFGRSSEKEPSPQLGLFNEAELEGCKSEAGEAAAVEAETFEVPAHQRRRGKRGPLPAHLPRVEVIHDLGEEEKHCPCGCGELRHIRDEVREEVDIVPARAQVLRHIYRIYASSCEELIRKAPVEPRPIPKSNASPGLLAYIATAKFVDGVPLHRQQAQFSRIGFELGRGTTARWMIRSGELVEPLIRLLGDTQDEYGIRHLDETRIQVLKEEGRRAENQSYIWVQKGGPPDRPVIRFHYHASRAHTVPLELLEAAEGYVQVDGYEAYEVVAGKNRAIVLVGCWAHARRKFDEVIKAQKKAGARTGKAHKALASIRKLYAIEKRLREQNASPAEVYRVRQAEAKPLLEEMRLWLEASLPEVPPKTLLGKALAYLHNQWDKLVRYLEDGRLHIDNNAVERALRPFVIGRKNWLFADTPKGAHASANLYSLIETAKLNGHEPYAYLRHVFKELPKAQTLEHLEALLPWNLTPAEITPG